jgi:hypothetical protein
MALWWPDLLASACYNLLMPGSDLALEKLSRAVRELDSSAGRIQERLAKAATYLIQVRPQELSDDAMRRVLAGIKDDLTFGEPEGKEDRVAGTLRNTDEADANAIATRIVKLYCALRCAS